MEYIIKVITNYDKGNFHITNFLCYKNDILIQRLFFHLEETLFHFQKIWYYRNTSVKYQNISTLIGVATKYKPKFQF